MFKEIIPRQTRVCLALLTKSKIFQEAYLAGGTASALQLGHRISNDLIFLRPKNLISDKPWGILKRLRALN